MKKMNQLLMILCLSFSMNAVAAVEEIKDPKGLLPAFLQYLASGQNFEKDFVLGKKVVTNLKLCLEHDYKIHCSNSETLQEVVSKDEEVAVIKREHFDGSFSYESIRKDEYDFLTESSENTIAVTKKLKEEFALQISDIDSDEVISIESIEYTNGLATLVFNGQTCSDGSCESINGKMEFNAQNSYLNKTTRGRFNSGSVIVTMENK